MFYIFSQMHQIIIQIDVDGHANLLETTVSYILVRYPAENWRKASKLLQHKVGLYLKSGQDREAQGALLIRLGESTHFPALWSAWLSLHIPCQCGETTPIPNTC